VAVPRKAFVYDLHGTKVFGAKHEVLYVSDGADVEIDAEEFSVSSVIR